MKCDEYVLSRAVAQYGDQQLVKACEELGELTQALCKLYLGGDWSEAAVDHAVEEIADVEIMLGQVRMILEVDPVREAAWRQRKLQRLAERLAERLGPEE